MEHNDVKAVILSAGKQERFGQERSKMMVEVGSKVAFEFTMQSILQVIPEKNITIISSNLFEAFNSLIRTIYPETTIVYDNDPGKGTLHSLKKALPLEGSQIFISESDIYYEASLIEGLLSLNKSGISVTTKTKIAPIHRGVVLNPFSINDHGLHLNMNASYRNIGAYILDTKYQSYLLESDHSNMIDFFRAMAHSSKCEVESFLYDGLYLHMAYPSDADNWISSLKSL